MSYKIQEAELLHDKKMKKDFIQVPWNLYGGLPHWVPPLRLGLAELFDPKHPFFKTSKMKAWVAYDQAHRPVARIVAIHNPVSQNFHQNKTGFFGFFECPEDQELANQLLKLASHYLKNNECDRIQGPVNPSTNYECGLLVKGFDDPAQIMMTYNPPYYKNLLENFGLEKAMDLLAYNYPMQYKLPEVILKIAERTKSKEKITYRCVDKSRWDQEVELMLSIYNDAWEKNWGFIPMTEEEFKNMANELKMVADPELILFAEVEGKPVAFIVCLPDFNQIFHNIPNGKLLPTGLFKLLFGKKKINRVRAITMGVKKDYRRLGLETLLYVEVKKAIAAKKRFDHVEMSWILEDNLNMNKPLIKMGATAYKTYRIFEKGLESV